MVSRRCALPTRFFDVILVCDSSRVALLCLFSTRHERFTSDVGLTRTRLVSRVVFTTLILCELCRIHTDPMRESVHVVDRLLDSRIWHFHGCMVLGCIDAKHLSKFLCWGVSFSFLNPVAFGSILLREAFFVHQVSSFSLFSSVIPRPGLVSVCRFNTDAVLPHSGVSRRRQRLARTRQSTAISHHGLVNVQHFGQQPTRQEAYGGGRRGCGLGPRCKQLLVSGQTQVSKGKVLLEVIGWKKEDGEVHR